MDFGTVPDWFAAVGTVGALFVSLVLLREDRRLRSSEQAGQVSAWAEWRREGRPQDTTPRQWFVYVNNASGAPVYVEVVNVARGPGNGPTLSIEFGTVAAHDTVDYGLPEEEFQPLGDHPFVDVTFIDARRMRWRVDSKAVLKRLGPAPTA